MTRVAVTTGDPGVDATEMRSVGGAWQADGMAELKFGVQGIGIDVRTPFVDAASPEDAIERCVPATVAALRLIAKGLTEGSINPRRPDTVVFHFADRTGVRETAALPPSDQGEPRQSDASEVEPPQLSEAEQAAYESGS